MARVHRRCSVTARGYVAAGLVVLAVAVSIILAPSTPAVCASWEDGSQLLCDGRVVDAETGEIRDTLKDSSRKG